MLVLKKENPCYALGHGQENATKANSGDMVVFETFDCFEDQIQSPDDGMETLDWDRINPVTGPLYVNEAKVGDILAVDIISIDIGDQIAMMTGPDMGALGDQLTQSQTRVFEIKDDKINFDGIEIPINKMIGVIGTAPKGEAIPSGVPDYHGGNMDCTEITENATLYLPVNVDGGMLYIGDLHAAMGDGEVAVCGGEVPGKVTVKVRVIKNVNLPTPAIVNEDTVMTVASEDTLDEAAISATKNMAVVLEHALSIDKGKAAMLMSLVGNLRVCQIVDPKLTMRMEVNRKYFNDNPYEG